MGAAGDFGAGDVVDIVSAEVHVARGLAQYSAEEVRRIARRHSNDIEAILGFRYGEAVVHRDDLVLLAPPSNLAGPTP